ncbi:putative serine esterase-domain-containing protein [Sporodiniella umbellata]|nr:putative serine esterase-domain-containing protein [Sporodiniella umbellata]
MHNKSKNTISLLVLSHGLWGVKRHMSYIEKKLKEKYKDSAFVVRKNIHIYMYKSKKISKYSYDGIDICGQRAAEQVEATLKQLNAIGKKVSKISFIGYSLGGLILRYAIGVLGERKLFDSVEPDCFATFASPHMGTKLPGNTLWTNFFNYVSGNFVSHSGEQLQLKDSPNKPLIYTLSDPNDIYFKYLARFKVKRSYANIANDRTVPYWTSGMETMNYFDRKNDDIEV